MTIHWIDLPASIPPPLSGHLRLGGSSPQGRVIAANSRHLTLDGTPWFACMGEFHFSRYPHPFWRRELLKMKAGGITICATYVFWNYHEEIQGRFTWEGNRDLRRFVEECGGAGLYCYPRIGPWAHGEARNGGFPDWLVEQCGKTARTDDPTYLAHVRRYFAELASQLRGLLWKDGGPVIGIQLENELLNNPRHIVTLKTLAIQAGLDVPIYTMTGWGPARVPQDEVIPVFGGYPDAFWERRHDNWSRSCRKHYFFSPIRDDNAIGADLRVRRSTPDLAYLERYPFGTCELGGGMPPSYHRRPWIAPEDVEAIAFCKLGSGANLLGYYMYHGATHAQGALASLEETQASGYPNDLPARSYDFQAPLGEYGQVRPHYHRLRRLHLFIHDFGADLAQMPTVFPAVRPASLDDRLTPRWAVRTDGRRGFVFVNTYQRVESLPGLSQVQFGLRAGSENLALPHQPINIPPGACLLLPFRLNLDGICLRSATASPLCRFTHAGLPGFVFYAAGGIAPEFIFDEGEITAVHGAPHLLEPAGGALRLHGLAPGPGCLLELEGRDGAKALLLVLSEADSLRLWKMDLWGAERLLLSPAALWMEETLHLSGRDPADLWCAIFPAPPQPPSFGGAAVQINPLGIFTRYTPAYPVGNLPAIAARQVHPAEPAQAVQIGPAGVAQAPGEDAYRRAETWRVHIPEMDFSNLGEVYLQIQYTGDAARAYICDGEFQELIADDFWYGRDWEIGLRRFLPRLGGKEIELRFLPLRQDAPVYIPPEVLPSFENGQALAVRAIRLVPEYLL